MTYTNYQRLAPINHWSLEVKMNIFLCNIFFMITSWYSLQMQRGVFFLLVAQRRFSWWRHQMETFSAILALCAGTLPVQVDSPHKAQWRGALMVSFICTWINNWVKKTRGWWFETPPWSLWRQCNVEMACCCVLHEATLATKVIDTLLRQV